MDEISIPGMVTQKIFRSMAAPNFCFSSVRSGRLMLGRLTPIRLASSRMASGSRQVSDRIRTDNQKELVLRVQSLQFLQCDDCIAGTFAVQFQIFDQKRGVAGDREIEHFPALIETYVQRERFNPLQLSNFRLKISTAFLNAKKPVKAYKQAC